MDWVAAHHLGPHAQAKNICGVSSSPLVSANRPTPTQSIIHPISPTLPRSPWVRRPDPVPTPTPTRRSPPDRNRETRRRRRRLPRRLCASSSWGPAVPTSVSGRSLPSTSPAPPPTIDSSPTSPRFAPFPPPGSYLGFRDSFIGYSSLLHFEVSEVGSFGGRHARQMPLRPPRLPARWQGPETRRPHLANNH
jgi:hypothetical protein